SNAEDMAQRLSEWRKELAKDRGTAPATGTGLYSESSSDDDRMDTELDTRYGGDVCLV
ncbi:hypothetical protein SARC_17987, partial [Sphaeroforma arctica JP610]